MTDAIVALCREPFRMTLEDVGKLTLKQVRLLLERIEGNADVQLPSISERDVFWYWGRQNKLKEYQIRTLWDKQCAERES